MKKEIILNEGMSIIEVVIAMAVFFLFSASAVSLILGSHDFSRKSEDLLGASVIAQDGIERAQAVFKKEWNKGVYARSAIATSSESWIFSGEGTSEQIGRFSRVIDYFPVYRNQTGDIVVMDELDSYLDIYSKKVVVTISWNSSNNNIEQNLTRETYITNWDVIFWESSEWSEEDQNIWLSNGDYDSLNSYVATTSDDFIEIKRDGSNYITGRDGIVESAAYDLGDEVIFDGLEWLADISDDCSNCSVRIQIKTALDDDGNPDLWSENWCGPDGEDGDDTDYFEKSFGELINTDHNGDQWIKYRAILNTSDSDYSPLLKSVKIGYEKK